MNKRITKYSLYFNEYVDTVYLVRNNAYLEYLLSSGRWSASSAWSATRVLNNPAHFELIETWVEYE